MKYNLYILQSEVKETYYVGMSNDPDRRLHFHNTDDRKAHTSRYRPWKMVYSHAFNTKEEASHGCGAESIITFSLDWWRNSMVCIKAR
jgi:predicted GIY-YIG superfamily endonuclease